MIGAGAGVLPAFDINNSDGAFGTSDLTIGLEGNAALSFQVTDAIDARIGYTFTSISPEYPEPLVIGSPDAPDPISSSDTINTGTVTIGYRL